MFDYSILNRPMFFFAYDFYKYKNDFVEFYFSYSKEMPGPISTTTDELIEDIHSYDYSVYAQRYEKFKKKYNSIDDGRGGKPCFTFDEAVDSKQTNRRLLWVIAAKEGICNGNN